MKFCIFSAICISLVFYGIVNPQAEFQLEKYFYGEFAFYSAEKVESPLITRTVDLGFSFIYFTSSQNAGELRQYFSRIDGESVTVNSRLNTKSVLRELNAKEVSRSTIGELSIVYAYSPRISTFITQNGKRINIQIATREDRTTIGLPVILGSY